MSKNFKPCTYYIVKQAMKETLKDVRLPKIVRDGVIKSKKVKNE